MREDYLRLLAVIVGSVLLGFSVDAVFPCLCLALLIYIFWYHRVFSQLLTYIQEHSQDEPHVSGISNELAREFQILWAQHKKHKSKLSNFLKRFQKSTKALPDAILIMGKQNEIQWANSKANEYLGIAWPQDNGQRLLNLIRDQRFAAFLHNLQTGQPLRLLSPLGNGLILEFRLVLYGRKQKLLLARDITEVARSNDIQHDFISNASHELRTPLTVIMGYLESFKDELDDSPADWRHRFEQMYAQSKRMQQLIGTLLTLSALEASAEQQQPAYVDVFGLLEQILAEARVLIDKQASGHSFACEIDQDLCLQAHRHNLYSIFSNVIFNAVQHSTPSGEICVRWYQDAQGIHFEVADSGPGIAALHVSRLTERFYRVVDGRSHQEKGNGLGLAIVKHALSYYQGDLHITSTLGLGSVFKCSFPSSLLRPRQENAATD